MSVAEDRGPHDSVDAAVVRLEGLHDHLGLADDLVDEEADQRSVGLDDAHERLARIRLGAPDIRMIIVTADTSAACLEKGVAVGADGFVAKIAVADELSRAFIALSCGERFISPGAFYLMLNVAMLWLFVSPADSTKSPQVVLEH